MEKLSDWKTEIVCPKCGTLLEIVKKDTKLTPADNYGTGLPTLYLKCVSCNKKFNLLDSADDLKISANITTKIYNDALHQSMKEKLPIPECD